MDMKKIVVKASFDDCELKPRENGFVARICKTGLAEIDAFVSNGFTFGIDVDGKKNVVFKENLLKASPEEKRHYQTKVSVIGKGGIYYTRYPNNNLRLVWAGPAGLIRIWEIALISQNSDFFLTMQQTYEARCYHDQGKIICPKFDKKWPQMVELLGDLITNKVSRKLLPISRFQPESENNGAGDLEPNTGRVLWFNFSQGYGAILTPDGVARVHWTQIVGRNGLCYLNQGEIVYYRELRNPVQTNTNRSTDFPWEAVGVMPL